MMTPVILTEPNTLLHQRSVPVTKFIEAKHIAEKLTLILKAKSKFWNRWVGFAANQIGYPVRMVALRNIANKYPVLINPQIIEKKFPFPYVEGCFSVKGFYLVKRYLWARVKFQTLTAEWHEIVLKGPSAIYQEIDHLNGILVSEVGKLLYKK